MPRACSGDQPRVMAGLSGWSAFSGGFIVLFSDKYQRACNIMSGTTQTQEMLAAVDTADNKDDQTGEREVSTR